MAIISSHTLNSVDGTHAGGIEVALFRIEPSGQRELIFETHSDEGGRLSERVELSLEDAAVHFELVLQTGAYFDAEAVPINDRQILEEVVIRFTMPDPEARYHIPMMLAPNSYSVWWSS